MACQVIARLLCSLVLLAELGCDRENRIASDSSARPMTGTTLAVAASKLAPRDVEPKLALTAAGSAYAASLFVDDEAVYLLTSSAAYRLVSGRAPQRWALSLGATPVLTAEHFVYWSDGAIRQAPKRGGEPRLLAQVPHTPQRLAASGNYFAWLDRAEDGRFTILTLDGPSPRTVFAPNGYVAALTLQDDQVFFVERMTSSSYRLGVVPLAGGPARYTPSQNGRTPSMLAAAGGLFYYDGPSLTVRRLSPELEHEEVVGRDVICSPIAVAQRVFCAQPGGLLAFSLDGDPPRVLPRGRSGTITAIAATALQTAWLLDVGEDQLAVQVLP